MSSQGSHHTSLSGPTMHNIFCIATIGTSQSTHTYNVVEVQCHIIENNGQIDLEHYVEESITTDCRMPRPRRPLSAAYYCPVNCAPKRDTQVYFYYTVFKIITPMSHKLLTSTDPHPHGLYIVDSYNRQKNKPLASHLVRCCRQELSQIHLMHKDRAIITLPHSAATDYSGRTISSSNHSWSTTTSLRERHCDDEGPRLGQTTGNPLTFDIVPQFSG